MPAIPTALHEGLVLRQSGLELVRRIGEGGQAEVWECKDLDVGNRLVAAKLISIPASLRSADEITHRRRQMQREIDNLAEVQHENVVVIYRPVGELEGDLLVVGYVMELSPWGDARGCVRPRGLANPLRLSEYMRANLRFAVMLLRQLMLGLDAIHAKNLLHSDIKPQNILCFEIDEPPFIRLKLSDFGIMRRLGAPPHGVYGTLPYMPPEQFSGIVVNRSDVYSLGLAFFEMITDRFRLDFATCGDDLDDHLEVHRAGAHRRLREFEVVFPELDVLLDEMTRPLESQRRDLAGLLSTSRYLESRAPAVELERDPDDLATPQFLFTPAVHEQRKERLRFLLLDVDKFGARDAALQLFQKRFANRFSIMEVYGTYDILIRIWLTDAMWDATREEIAHIFPAGCTQGPGALPFEFHTVDEIQYLWLDGDSRSEDHTVDFHALDLLQLDCVTDAAIAAAGAERIPRVTECQELGEKLKKVGIVLRRIEPDEAESFRAYSFLRPSSGYIDQQWSKFVEYFRNAESSKAAQWRLTLHLARDTAIIAKVVVPSYRDLGDVIRTFSRAYTSFVGTDTFLDTKQRSFVTDAWQR
ncbi:MAG: serine/threonine-protein kinase [Candidatus Binatia bacterium]